MRSVIVICCLLLAPIAVFVVGQEVSPCPPLHDGGAPLAKTTDRGEANFTVDLPELGKVGIVSGTAFYTRTAPGQNSRFDDVAWNTGQDAFPIGSIRRLPDGWYVLESVTREGGRGDDYAMQLQPSDQSVQLVRPFGISSAVRNRCGAAVE